MKSPPRFASGVSRTYCTPVPLPATGLRRCAADASKVPAAARVHGPAAAGAVSIWYWLIPAVDTSLQPAAGSIAKPLTSTARGSLTTIAFGPPARGVDQAV